MGDAFEKELRSPGTLPTIEHLEKVEFQERFYSWAEWPSRRISGEFVRFGCEVLGRICSLCRLLIERPISGDSRGPLRLSSMNEEYTETEFLQRKFSVLVILFRCSGQNDLSPVLRQVETQEVTIAKRSISVQWHRWQVWKTPRQPRRYRWGCWPITSRYSMWASWNPQEAHILYHVAISASLHSLFLVLRLSF